MIHGHEDSLILQRKSSRCAAATQLQGILPGKKEQDPGVKLLAFCHLIEFSFLSCLIVLTDFAVSRVVCGICHVGRFSFHILV